MEKNFPHSVIPQLAGKLDKVTGICKLSIGKEMILKLRASKADWDHFLGLTFMAIWFMV
jgi:hypothetical protein